MQSGKDFRVRKTKITRYIFKYITRFWTLKSTSILGGSFTSALFPQTVWCSHGWTFAPLRATPTVHWTTYFGWRKVKTCRYRRFWPMRSCDWWWGAPRKDPTPNCKYLRRELQALISPHEIPRLFRVRPDSCAFTNMTRSPSCIMNLPSSLWFSFKLSQSAQLMWIVDWKPDGIHSSLLHSVAVACGGSSESTEKGGGGDSRAGGEHLIMYKWDSCWRSFAQIVGSSSMYSPLVLSSIQEPDKLQGFIHAW